MKQLVNSIALSFSHLLFPPLCLHCRETVYESNGHICHDCSSLLDLIEPSERCPRCFSMEYIFDKKRCPACYEDNSLLQHMAAAFDYIGPAATLVKKFKYGNQPYLCKGIGAYMVAQFFRLGWPMPNLIVPVPISLVHRIDRGYNQSHLIAEEIAALLKIPLGAPLGRDSGDYSQAGMDRNQRKELSASTFYLKKESAICDKIILLIDDVMTTGSTLQRCTEVLADGCPAQVYALTFCRAI